MDQPIKVLIVDDHPALRFGLVALLKDEPEFNVVAEARDGVEAVEKALACNPDVILMDLGLPKKSGLEAIVEILQHSPHIRILVFTSYSNGDQILAAIKAGAIGYILKDNTPQEIHYAILNAYHGKPTLSVRSESNLFEHIRNTQQVERPVEALTPREIEMLRWLASGLSNAEMAQKASVTEGTVRSHISNLINKLGFENRAQAVIYAVKHGLVDINE